MGEADRASDSPATRVVVVGADAAGMSAAHQALRTAKRTGRELAVTVLDRGTHTSYSACGIPYWMAGDVDAADDLVARTADEHRAAGIDLRMGTEVVAADLSARTVTTADGEVVGYDELVVATGAPAVVPDWALRPDGTTYDGVGAVKTLDDGAAWLERFAAAPARARTWSSSGRATSASRSPRPRCAGVSASPSSPARAGWRCSRTRCPTWSTPACATPVPSWCSAPR